MSFWRVIQLWLIWFWYVVPKHFMTTHKTVLQLKVRRWRFRSHFRFWSRYYNKIRVATSFMFLESCFNSDWAAFRICCDQVCRIEAKKTFLKLKDTVDTVWRCLFLSHSGSSPATVARYQQQFRFEFLYGPSQLQLSRVSDILCPSMPFRYRPSQLQQAHVSVLQTDIQRCRFRWHFRY